MRLRMAKEDVAFLLDRVRWAGRCLFTGDREVGISSNSIVAIAYGQKTLAEQEVLRVTDHAAVEALRAAADVAKRMRVTVVKWPGLINVNKPYASAAQCKQLRTTLIVDGAGDIATCCRGAGPRAELGNILRDGARAWWSPAAEALRHTRPAKCRFCNI
jgi:hypothetical protein